MKISDLLKIFDFKDARGNLDLAVEGCSSDSRHVRPGDLFFCFSGEKADGHDYALQAIKKGAVGVVAQRVIPNLPEGTPFLLVDDVRSCVGPISSTICGHPSLKLRVLGVTGTSGKTTTTYFLERCLNFLGRKAEILGSLNPTPEFPFHTTPEAPALQRRLKEFLNSGGEYAVLEVSSHAIHFGRVNGVRFEGAVLTNIYRDHLDLHKTQKEYALTKLRWLKSLCGKCPVVVNVDFPSSEECLEFLGEGVVTVSLDGKGEINGTILQTGNWGSRIKVNFPGGSVTFRIALPGEVNASNSLSAFGLLFSLGFDPEKVAIGLSILEEVKGRYKKIPSPWGASVVIDYAHTPIALEKALNFARSMGKRVILVFGCVGSGDKEKRPIMGRIAARLADLVFVTTDDPRDEDPRSTIEGIKEGLLQEGLKEGEGFFVVSDRAKAIQEAIGQSKEGDVILIAGRGHEKYQRFGKNLIYLDDEEEARKAMNLR
ncbi:MAG: UDP-N-acetylmuramoyl-L-alanyl-D-glutamate--2,6-diaminopimelate ligase [Caldiserica bacterium]|jgi:UDP-N-acetylmuramoyl-L-alanyl-D-glutamate--2,6-diaminopimelate ligase|nr:UDP-N-acetylmuramoyl-L-alanyl-D-glutamate--2,6-diaminopimelate ligase [Caldisericota bacterium]MDH7562995.1 UDP-N-acetylmuramoyl-L-alanyl-D-glutamate--2,6-diaminopimelate ligase [Caldisericota bacterium]